MASCNSTSNSWPKVAIMELRKIVAAGVASAERVIILASRTKWLTRECRLVGSKAEVLLKLLEFIVQCETHSGQMLDGVAKDLHPVLEGVVQMLDGTEELLQRVQGVPWWAILQSRRLKSELWAVDGKLTSAVELLLSAHAALVSSVTRAAVREHGEVHGQESREVDGREQHQTDTDLPQISNASADTVGYMCSNQSSEHETGAIVAVVKSCPLTYKTMNEG
eukprot:evm.model.scf_2689.3 EVM.evm.TU.scf_2689.3   scf_2689:10988-12945(-)